MKLEKLDKELSKIFFDLIKREPTADFLSSVVHAKYRLSAKNLYRYLVLRSHDLRKIHDSLSDLGISSLRTAEGYVLHNLATALQLTRLLGGKNWEAREDAETIGYSKSKKLLQKHSNKLFGSKDKKRRTHIMVTMPTEAAENLDLLRQLAKEGMEIARINLSHDSEEIWEQMVQNLKLVSEELGIPIQIYMDLSGPKIRTGDIAIKKKKKKKNKKVIQNFIRLQKGDHLWLCKDVSKAKKAIYGHEDEVISWAEVGVTLPQIIDDLKVGDPVYFDDGKIEAEVLNKEKDRVELLILQAHKPKLSSQKGINLPKTQLNLPSLTEKDIEHLPFVIEHADIVGYSFVRNAGDVERLYEELNKHKGKELGVVFKIETEEAFESLPLILLAAMQKGKIGVMIARGDLAVEIGYEKISEVQNQILWLCEAAHIPVIWATQVLENLAKKGIATRAEVSDAAISVQAECVMLNKGPFIVGAVKTLHNILVKMDSHTSKKKSTMRPLEVAIHNLERLSAINEAGFLPIEDESPTPKAVPSPQLTES